MPSSEISKPHPVCPRHINCMETFLKSYQKQEVASVYHHELPFMCEKKYCEMSTGKKVETKNGINVHWCKNKMVC